MNATKLELGNVGPMKKADITFGDLTVLIGPQASGKSIFLQFAKLLLDNRSIFRTLKAHGLDWDRDPGAFLDVFLGEGMRNVWTPGKSTIRWRGENVDLAQLVRSGSKGRDTGEKSFFIPAQRVLGLSKDGWLRYFDDYRAGDPFTVRDFSEKLRIMMESGLGRSESIYPQAARLKAAIRRLLSQSIFGGFQLKMKKDGPQKRLVLEDSTQQTTLPFMVWSAGQREFVPLLLGLYWLLPPTRVKRRDSIEWVIIEELEMGLHPKAIETMLFIVLELLWRGYRVCLSTHSPHVLDFVWALRNLAEHGADPKTVLKLFGVKPTPPVLKLGEAALKKKTRVYYFDRESGISRDISRLDPGSVEHFEADWGGLTEFSSHAADVVAQAVQDSIWK